MSPFFASDTLALTGRTLRHVTRSLDTVITTVLTPIAIMVLFVYVLGGAIHPGTASYVDYTLPGILLITVASGVAYTAIRVFSDVQTGIFERFRSMPVARSALLWAHVITSVAANLVSVAIVVVVAVVMGFRPGAGPGAWLAAGGIVVAFTLAMTWVAVIPGLTARSADGAGAFAYPIILLPFVSSAFVPTGTMPGPVRAFAEHQPVTSIVDAVRGLLDGQPVGRAVWTALGWCLAVLAVAVAFALRAYRRSGT